MFTHPTFLVVLTNLSILAVIGLIVLITLNPLALLGVLLLQQVPVFEQSGGACTHAIGESEEESEYASANIGFHTQR